MAFETMDIAQTALTEVIRRAREASRHAWAPYSKFAVGAAVLTDDGAIYSGANVENASYGLSMCAERNAIFQAVAQGARRIVALAVYTSTTQATLPCGACLQVAREFATDALVICCTDDAKAERRFRLADLLPHAFTLQRP
jgi:cytidine deaminase